MLKKRVPLFLIIFVIISGSILSGNNSRLEPEDVFSAMEEGFSKGEVSKFSNYFSRKTYISLFNGVSGYYSTNQAFYVMEDFFEVYRPVSFNFYSVRTDSDSPFASGVLRYSTKNSRESAQVFVSLRLSEGKWIITQLTIN
jgi:hypothetical protein